VEEEMIQGRRLNNLAAEITARQFNIVSGVTETLGGADEGPSPHEILEAALAACTIITVQMYANRKQMKLESTNVTVKVESESKEASVISRQIEFVGDLSDAEKAKLLEIAGKCPIHKLLESQIKVETTMS